MVGCTKNIKLVHQAGELRVAARRGPSLRSGSAREASGSRTGFAPKNRLMGFAVVFEGPHPISEAGSELGTVLKQAHQHAALVILATKEHGQHLDVALLSAWSKPIHCTIESQVSKAWEEIIV